MRRTDRRAATLALVAAVVIALGALVQLLPGRGVEWAPGAAPPPPRDSDSAPTSAPATAGEQPELRTRFEQAVLMLHAKRYEEALVALGRVLELAPGLPEAHVNAGYAWLGLGEPGAALAAFERALDLRPGQANAYYGLALAAERLGDRPAALGAMRAFVHLTPGEDPFVRKARAALWEWQEGPSPPGASEASPAPPGPVGGPR